MHRAGHWPEFLATGRRCGSSALWGALGRGPVARQHMTPWTPVAMAATSCASCQDAQWPQGVGGAGVGPGRERGVEVCCPPAWAPCGLTSNAHVRDRSWETDAERTELGSWAAAPQEEPCSAPPTWALGPDPLLQASEPPAPAGGHPLTWPPPGTWG